MDLWAIEKSSTFQAMFRLESISTRLAQTVCRKGDSLRDIRGQLFFFCVPIGSFARVTMGLALVVVFCQKSNETDSILIPHPRVISNDRVCNLNVSQITSRSQPSFVILVGEDRNHHLVVHLFQGLCAK